MTGATTQCICFSPSKTLLGPRAFNAGAGNSKPTTIRPVRDEIPAGAWTKPCNDHCCRRIPFAKLISVRSPPGPVAQLAEQLTLNQ